jgi:hypothetical protein
MRRRRRPRYGKEAPNHPEVARLTSRAAASFDAVEKQSPRAHPAILSKSQQPILTEAAAALWLQLQRPTQAKREQKLQQDW